MMKVFISYTSEDSSIVKRLSSYLVAQGYVVSAGVDSANPGDVLVERISDEISTSDAVIVLLSKRYDRNRWAETELSMAVYQQAVGKVKRILPVVTASGATVPPLLSGLRYLDATNRSDDHVFSQISEGLRSSESSTRVATKQLRSLNEQLEALGLETELWEKRQAYRITAVFRDLGLLAVVLGFGLGLALIRTTGKWPGMGWFDRLWNEVVPIASVLLGFFLGRRDDGRRSSDVVGTHESGVRE